MVAVLPTLAGSDHLIVQRRFREAEWPELAQRHRAARAMLVPVQTQRLLAHRRFETTNLTSYDMQLGTSALLAPEIVREALAYFPGQLVNIHRVTEDGVGTMLDCTARPEKLQSVGRPMLSADFRLIDG